MEIYIHPEDGSPQKIDIPTREELQAKIRQACEIISDDLEWLRFEITKKYYDELWAACKKD
jgi:hypothetical protein